VGARLKAAIGLYALAATTSAAAQDVSLFRFTETPGPHAVGLKGVEQYDYSRTYRARIDESGKPYSWGGISNLFAAAQDDRIDALVSLDGSARYSPGLCKRAGDVHPERMTLPLLFFTEAEETREDQELDAVPLEETDGPNVLNA
jgi:hypothetical protein